MSVTESIKHVAGRCNNCGATINTEVNYFNLALQRIQVNCPVCGQSSLTLNAEDGQEVSISAPCPACGELHGFKRKLKNFFKEGEDIFRFMCPLSGIEICFIGDEDRIQPAVANSKKELEKLISEYQESKGIPEEERYDSVLSDAKKKFQGQVLGFIKHCADKNSIVCRCCDMESTPTVGVELLEDGAILTCKSCGRKLKLTSDDVTLLNAFVMAEKIIIDD